MPEQSPTDAELIQRCLNGDASAWTILVERYAGLVHSVPIRHGLRPMEVDDVGQEVFLALARSLHQIENPDALAAWLTTTARRLSWRALQKRAREQPVEAGDLTDPARPPERNMPRMPSMEELLNGWHRQDALRTAMARLGERCRELLYLLFLDPEEPSYEEICERMNMRMGSIGPTRRRCLDKLRLLLEELGFRDP